MNKIDHSKLVECIKEILDDSDLKSISAKAIRIKLQEKLNKDFTNDKSEIDKLIMKLYEEKLPKSDDSSSDLDEDNDVTAKKRKAQPAPKSEPKKRKPDLKTPKNGALTAASTTTSTGAESVPIVDSSANNDNDDAEIARALQAEMNGMRNVRKSTLLTSKKSKESKKNKAEKGDQPRRATGFSKVLTLSQELSTYLGAEQMPRQDVVKRLWDIAKEKDMFDPTNRQFVLCDDDWQRLFAKKRIRMFAISKFLEKHFVRD